LYVTDGRSPARTTDDNIRLVAAALAATVAEFGRRGIRVWLLEEVPYVEQPVANFLARAMINGVAPERLTGVPVGPHQHLAPACSIRHPCCVTTRAAVSPKVAIRSTATPITSRPTVADC
jgi:hypothetical protein